MVSGQRAAWPRISDVRRGRLRALLRPAAAGVLLVAFGLPAGALAASPPPTPAPQAGPIESAQELTLEALGLPTQTVFGRSNSVAMLFPPPAGPLAGTGSLLRVVFAHSPLLDPAASTVAFVINGQRLASIALEASTADGAIVELHVPTPALRGDGPNLVEVRFDLRLAGRAGDDGDNPSAFARLEGQTLLRYQLSVPPGSPPPARLEAYPFPLVGTHALAPARLGLVMPRPPADPDLGAAFRLVADLGRRSQGQEVVPEVVTANQVDWLRAGGVPALVVGALQGLPAADAVLRAAGFTTDGATWISPDGAPLAPGDGILAAVVSPWDHQSPIVLATGGTDDAVGRAVTALVAPGSRRPSGGFAIVRPGTPPGPDTSPRPGTTMPIAALRSLDLAVQGTGGHTATLTFAAPPVDRGDSGLLMVHVGHSALPAAPRSTFTALLNGTGIGTVVLDGRNESDSPLALRFPGSLLRPGLNTLTLGFALAGAEAAPAVARVAAGASIRLPASPTGPAGMELLPYPVFSDPTGVRIVLANTGDPLLTAAAHVMAALGSRSTGPPKLSATYLAEVGGGAVETSAVLVGLSAASVDAERLTRALGLPVHPPWPGGLVEPAGFVPGQPLGVVREVTLPGAPAHSVLWVDGSSAETLYLASDALYQGGLAGSAVAVDANGRVRSLGQDEVATPDPPQLLVVRVLVVATAATLLLGVCWQAWRPRHEPRP